MPDNNTPGLEYSVYFGYFDNDVDYFDRNDTRVIVIGPILGGQIQKGFTTDGTSIDTLTNGMFRGGPNRSAQWKGYFTPHKSGIHKFQISSFESSILWIGNKNESSVSPQDKPLIMNNNEVFGRPNRRICHLYETLTTSTGEIFLEQFTTYPIRMQYGFKERYSIRKMTLCFQEPGNTSLIYNLDGYVNFNDDIKQRVIDEQKDMNTIDEDDNNIFKNPYTIDTINKIEIGEKINYTHENNIIPGTVIKKNDDGTYDIAFEDSNGVEIVNENVQRKDIYKLHENITPVIYSTGWYFVSSPKSQTFQEYISSSTSPSHAKVKMYNFAYFVSDRWKNTSTIKSSNYSTISTLNTLMSPYIGYWIYITHFEVNELFAPDP